MLSFEITPIGTIQNDRTDVQHTDNWGAVRSLITVDERFGEACLQGLEGFSHVEVLFIFDQFPEHGDFREPRPYRGRSDLPPGGRQAAGMGQPPDVGVLPAVGKGTGQSSMRVVAERNDPTRTERASWARGAALPRVGRSPRDSPAAAASRG